MNNATLLRIDNIKLLVKGQKTIYQVCTLLNKNLPHLCYNNKLLIAGNCRICLVEVKGLIKPIVACANPISENMSAFTNTPLVLKAREGVSEFLLINHPLDCPVCDEGGECDLQEVTMMSGRPKTRFFLLKRGVPKKNININIESEMNRCIHCTKCVRLAFITGLTSFGMAARGYNSEIFQGFTSKTFLSGNIADICPVSYFVGFCS